MTHFGSLCLGERATLVSQLSKAGKWIVTERIITHSSQLLQRRLQVAVFTLEEKKSTATAQSTAHLFLPDIVFALPRARRVLE